MPKCPKCGKYTPDTECEFVGHNHKCSICGTCPDCVQYERDLERYENMIRDPDYYIK